VTAGIDPTAAAELDEAVEWYEHRRAGLGLELLVEIRSAVQAVSSRPKAGSPIHGVDPALEVRRVPVRRFPYQVVYVVGAAGIVVIAVAHDRRRPTYWASRVEPDEGA
jgi:plasmid stabilization system protein ParE